MRPIVLLGVLAILAASLAFILAAPGGHAAGSTPFSALSSVPVPEVPAKAAELVHASGGSEDTAREVVRTASAITRFGVLPYVVSAICRRNPETAGAVVATAIELQPENALILLKAALCAAPRQAEQIVFSACQASPGSDGDMMLLACSQLPSARNEIRAGFLRARPELKLYFDEAEIEAGTNNLEVVILRTGQLLAEDRKTWAK